MESSHGSVKELISWESIRSRVRSLPQNATYYGVPRGGAYISAMLNPVMNPEEADFIIDDLIDSGETKKIWTEKYPKKKFIGLFDKIKETNLRGKWLVFPWEVNDTERDIEDHFRRVLQYFDDIHREGLVDTPKRYIKFLHEFLSPAPFNFTTFENEGNDQMITQSNIHFYSLCEHHLAPFFGKAKVSYIPDNKIVGLSKLARTVDWYARRFQNQERITQQIASRLMEELSPQGVGVQIEAHHLCMSMRGIQKPNAITRTTALKGIYLEQKVKDEFLKL